MKPRTCSRCRLILPGSVDHDDAEECLDAVLPRFGRSQHDERKWKKHAAYLAGTVSELKATVKAQKEYIRTLEGNPTEKRMRSLEQEVRAVRKLVEAA
jgi:hypothetical protein